MVKFYERNKIPEDLEIENQEAIFTIFSYKQHILNVENFSQQLMFLIVVNLLTNVCSYDMFYSSMFKLTHIKDYFFIVSNLFEF